jgi:hypothetical protein
MTTKELLDEAMATGERLKREIADHRAEVAAAQREDDQAQVALAKLINIGREVDRSQLGEALLRQHEKAAALAAVQGAVAPLIEDAERQIAELEAKAHRLQHQLDGEGLSALIVEYERAAMPLWALADKIRAQAVKAGVQLEANGPLLNRRQRSIANYPLQLPSVAA